MCCSNIIGTIPAHPNLYWNSAVQVWDVPTGESKVKRGFNNYAYHYRAYSKSQGVSKRNQITRKIAVGWKNKTREEQEKWADWDWAVANIWGNKI